MPTCTHINYHLEAQRKARFIQRKQAALEQLRKQQYMTSNIFSNTPVKKIHQQIVNLFSKWNSSQLLLQMAAYHLEALRRQRVIDRKHLALEKISVEKEEEERRLQEEIELRSKLQQEQDENRRREREEHLRQRGQGGKKRTDKQTQVKLLSQKDLRHQSKILRDHGLVMGHVNDRFHS